jgi:DNA-binding transcriptional LysR family regulator
MIIANLSKASLRRAQRDLDGNDLRSLLLELVRLLPLEPAMASELWLLTHPDLRRTARVRAFMDALAQGLRRERPLLEGRAG